MAQIQVAAQSLEKVEKSVIQALDFEMLERFGLLEEPPSLVDGLEDPQGPGVLQELAEEQLAEAWLCATEVPAAAGEPGTSH